MMLILIVCCWRFSVVSRYKSRLLAKCKKILTWNSATEHCPSLAWDFLSHTHVGSVVPNSIGVRGLRLKLEVGPCTRNVSTLLSLVRPVKKSIACLGLKTASHFL